MGRILFRKTIRWRRLRKFGWYIDGAFLYLLWLLVRPMRPARASATGRTLLRWLGPKTHKHQKMLRNLSLAFPEMDADRIEALARDIWGNFGAMLAEYPHLSRIAINGSSPTIELVMDEAARAILENGRPAIYVTAHLGNWELAASTIAALGVPLCVVYGPQGNPVLEKLLQGQRRSLGCRFIGKKNAVRQMIRELRAGHSVGLLPDQRVDSGEIIPFFGLDAPTTTSPAWLALKLGCPLVPVQTERTGNARFRVTFHAPLERDANGEDERQRLRDMTMTVNRQFEEWIRQRPQQWLCIKRRWPTSAYDTTGQPSRRAG